jgi:hypothetical protein
MTSAADFTAWLEASAPGETLTYHVGCLARDRVDLTDDDGAEIMAVPGLDKLAKLVTKAIERGDVAVTQRRIGPNR